MTFKYLGRIKEVDKVPIIVKLYRTFCEIIIQINNTVKFSVYINFLILKFYFT